ncbi:MAG: hypothetical protein M3Y59_15830 [Myxococcota bacterium]|nr:hypothetical protein [Myxococcota bacterium]
MADVNEGPDGGQYFQGWSAAGVVLEYGLSPTATHVDSRAKSDDSAAPSTFPEITAPRHQHTDGGPSCEASMICGQAPGPELIASRYQRFLDDGGTPGLDPEAAEEQAERQRTLH